MVASGFRARAHRASSAKVGTPRSRLAWGKPACGTATVSRRKYQAACLDAGVTPDCAVPTLKSPAGYRPNCLGAGAVDECSWACGEALAACAMPVLAKAQAATASGRP